MKSSFHELTTDLEEHHLTTLYNVMYRSHSADIEYYVKHYGITAIQLLSRLQTMLHVKLDRRGMVIYNS